MKHRKYSFDLTFSSHLPSRPLRPGATDYERIASKIDRGGDTCSRITSPRYTGDQLIGIATLHKSNAVPVTVGSDMAIAISKMRRG